MAVLPNILFITTDQHRYDCAGFSGHPLVRTPYLDSVAKQAVVFDAAYCSVPTCVASRASILTGRFCRQMSWHNETVPRIGDSDSTVARVLRGAGYHTLGIGKMHFRPMRDAHGFDTLRLCEEFESAEVLEDDYHPWLQGHGYDDYHERWECPRGYRDAPKAFREMLQAMPSPVPEDLYHSTWISNEAVAFLKGPRAQQPWFMWLSFLKPHHPFDPPHPWQQLYDPQTVPFPDRDPGKLQLLPDVVRDALTTTCAHGAFDLSVLDDTLLRRVIAYYFATISHVDRCVGRVVEQLYQSGMFGRTAIVFTADHGEFLGQRGRLFKTGNQFVLFDDLVRVPLMVMPPGGRSPLLWIHPVKHVDLAPTMAQLAGAPTPPEWAGRSLLTQLEEEPTSAFAFSETAAGGHGVMLRKGNLKFMRHEQGNLPELYDLAVDPGERHNRALDTAYLQERNAMERELEQLLSSLRAAR